MKTKILAAFNRYATKVDALLNEFEPLSEAVLNQKPTQGGWSAMQTIHHLILVEENSLAYIHKKLSFNPQFEKAGFSALGRSVLLWLSMVSPLKFKAPKSAANELLPAYATFAETKTRWQKSRLEWLAFLEKMPDELMDKTVYKHPRAGRLSWQQTFNFFSAHLERHRLQAHRAVS